MAIKFQTLTMQARPGYRSFIFNQTEPKLTINPRLSPETGVLDKQSGLHSQ